MGPKYKLTHFNHRGAAEGIRFIFAYKGIEFEDERVEHDADWPNKKPKYPYGQLPVLEVDGNQVLSQSGAIVRYLGRIFDLAGDTVLESAKCDEIYEALIDFNTASLPIGAEQDEKKKAELSKKFTDTTVPTYLGQWEKALGANGGFLVGKRFSYADFSVASFLEAYNEFYGGKLFDDYPKMKLHSETVFALNGIKEWMAKRPKTQF